MRFVVIVAVLGSMLMVCGCNTQEEANTTPPASANTVDSKSGLAAPANAPGPAPGKVAPATE